MAGQHELTTIPRSRGPGWGLRGTSVFRSDSQRLLLVPRAAAAPPPPPPPSSPSSPLDGHINRPPAHMTELALACSSPEKEELDQGWRPTALQKRGGRREAAGGGGDTRPVPWFQDSRLHDDHQELQHRPPFPKRGLVDHDLCERHPNKSLGRSKVLDKTPPAHVCPHIFTISTPQPIRSHLGILQPAPKRTSHAGPEGCSRSTNSQWKNRDSQEQQGRPKTELRPLCRDTDSVRFMSLLAGFGVARFSRASPPPFFLSGMVQ